MRKPAQATKQAPGKERRRSPRVVLAVPVQIDWIAENGKYEEADARTEIVSAHGALLHLNSERLPTLELRVRNPETGAVAWAAVVSIERLGDGSTRMAVTFPVPNATFWGEGVPPPYSETG